MNGEQSNNYYVYAGSNAVKINCNIIYSYFPVKPCFKDDIVVISGHIVSSQRGEYRTHALGLRNTVCQIKLHIDFP